MTAHDYEPTMEDIAWARAALSLTKNGGTLAMIAAEMLWRVDHDKKVVVLVNSERLFTQVGKQTYLRTKATLERLGYTVAPS